MSLKDKILSAQDIQKETMDIPEWDCVLEIRVLTARQRNDLLEKFMNKKNREVEFSGYNFGLLAASIFDPETGEKVFTADEAAIIGDKSGAVVDRILKRLMVLNGLDADAAVRAEKN